MNSLIIHKFNLSIKLYKSSNFQSAISELKKIEHCSEYLRGYWAVLAICYQKVGELESSEASFVKAIDIDRLNCELYAQFASLLIELKKYDDAEFNYIFAIKLNGSNYVFHYNLGLFYFNRGLYSKAVKILSNSLSINSEHDKSFYLLIQSQILCGEYDSYVSARDSLFSLLNKDLLNRRALKLWAEALWLRRDGDWKLFYDIACDRGIINLDILGDFISKLVDANMPEYAESVLDSLSVKASYLKLDFLRSFVLYSLGMYEKSFDMISSLPEEYFESNVFKRLMVYILLALSRSGDALEVSKKLVYYSDDFSQEDIALLASCYKLEGEWSEYRNIYNFDDMVKVFFIPIPKGFSNIEEFNKEIESSLLKLHRNGNHPIEQSLRNGSQTEGNLFNICSEVFSKLEFAISSCVREFINSMPDDRDNFFFRRKSSSFRYTGSWSVRLATEGFHRNHFHNDGWISGCYYVNVPDIVNEHGQGWIKFGELESAYSPRNDADFYIKPVAGSVVFFPSYMWHGTVPFISEHNRLTVAFDLIPE